jgi:transcriptional regulator with XRE-family HTH domain
MKNLNIIIANNVRQLRKHKGLSQEALADECDLHRTYIGAVERGERNLTINTLVKIAKALETEVINLLKE